MKERGFTLVELIVVLAIIGIVAGIVVANISFMNPCSRLHAVANDLLGAINIARANAMRSSATYQEFLVLISSKNGRSYLFVIKDVGGEIRNNITFFDPENPAAILGGGDEITDLPTFGTEGEFPRGTLLRIRSDINGKEIPFPFSTATVSECNFCQNGNGAIVFLNDGTVDFAPLQPDSAIIVVGLEGRYDAEGCAPAPDAFAIAITRVTGFTRLYSYSYESWR